MKESDTKSSRESDTKSSRKRKRSVIISNDKFVIVSLEKEEFPPRKKRPSVSSVNQSYVVSRSKKKKRESCYEKFIKDLFNSSSTSNVELVQSQSEDFGAASGTTPENPPSVEEFSREELSREELSSEEPSSEESSSEEPSSEEPSTEEPLTEEHSTEEPSTEEPSTEEPLREELSREEPSREEPSSEEPSSEEPSSEEEAECNEENNAFTDFLNSFPTLPDSDNEKEQPSVCEDSDGFASRRKGKAKKQESKSEENDYQLFNESKVVVEETDEKQEKKEKKRRKYTENRILKLSDSVCVVRIPSKSTEVLLLTHPASASLLKHITVRVLSGGISIFGYSMDCQSSPVKLFSSKKTGIITLNTEYSESMWKNRDLYKSVKRSLQAISSTETAMEILAECTNSTVIVVLERCLYPSPIQFVKLYFSHVFHFKTKPQRNQDRAFCELNGQGSIRFSTFCDSLAEKINECIRRSTIKDEPGPRILVLGPKKCGKSSLVRFLINKTLHTFQEVYYLESDPGQTEFTPPGVISLTKVTKPLLGPPFMHLKKPKKMIFTGSITPETSPDMYNKSIYQLMEHYNSSYSLEPLFVNTMGWITGIGAECLQNLIKAVEPTFLINLIQVKRARFDCRKFLNENVKYIEINILKPHENVGGFTAFEMRHLAMLAYLGRCQSPFLRPLYLNEMQPYCVCWDKIAVYVFNRRLPPYRLLEALNGSIVALCNVDESLILESDIPGFQKTLKNEPENDCLGFGVVRAVDETNHLLFIITPLPLKELKNVNAIMKGNILLPQEVLLEQRIDYTAMPFTDHPTAVPTASRKRIQKRVRRQQN